MDTRRYQLQIVTMEFSNSTWIVQGQLASDQLNEPHEQKSTHGPCVGLRRVDSMKFLLKLIEGLGLVCKGTSSGLRLGTVELELS